MHTEQHGAKYATSHSRPSQSFTVINSATDIILNHFLGRSLMTSGCNVLTFIDVPVGQMQSQALSRTSIHAFVIAFVILLNGQPGRRAAEVCMLTSCWISHL